MDDLAHAFRFHCRSVKDLQTVRLKGKFGKQQGLLKPFDGLSAAQIKEELRARGVFDLTGNKNQLTVRLQNELLGVQRVPSFLVTKPEQPWTELNLDTYTILDCEPLHDLKGHLTNILEELPNIVTGETQTISKS